MALLPELLRRLRFLVLRDRYTAELEEEMRTHIALREGRLRERGVAPGEARYVARRRFGNPGDLQERSRDMWGLSWFEHAAADVRFAIRRLRHRPGFSVATITVAALGIGATTAVFSAVDAALLRPLPFIRSSELVTLTDVNIPFDHSGRQFPVGRHELDINDAAAMHDLFASTAAFAAGGLNLSDATSPRRVRVGVVSTEFFSTLGVRPQLGRTFDVTEGRPNGGHPVVLSDALWRSKFGGSEVLGRTIDLSGTRYTVVGVMAPEFNFPNESDLWIPLTVPLTDEVFAPFRGYLPSTVIARVASGVTIPSANVRLLDRWRQISGPQPESRIGGGYETLTELRTRGAVVPLKRQLVGDREQPLLILMGATTLLLLIASANVANLLLLDAASRRREIALREILGASRGRVVRQLLTESVLLASAGAVIGVALSPVGLSILQAMMPADLAGVAPAELNVRVLGFATALAVITGLAFGMWPAFGAARGDSIETIKSAGGGGGTSRGLGTTRRALIVAEVALTVMLLVGSGLMLRSLHRVLSRQLGIDPARVGTLELSFAGGAARAARLEKVHGILERLNADPGIQGAAAVNDIPLRVGGMLAFRVEVDGVPKSTASNGIPVARELTASGGYFRAMGIPLLRGRTFTTSDDSLAPRVAVVNKAMVERWWPNVDAIGRTFRFTGDTTTVTVVGVVGDVREQSLEGEAMPQVYVPIDARTPNTVAIVARSALPAGVVLSRLTDAVRSVDRTQAVYNLRMLDDIVATSVAPRQTNTTLITLFAGIALALSAFGVYAVVSYSVARRAREFGIRAALGATGRNIASLVGREMAMIVAVGLVVGIVGAWMLSRVMASLVFRMDVHDVATFLAVPLVLVLPAAIATIIPARRAMRASPTEVMRAE
jgi:putative ABC transport system permease protein